MRPVIPGSYGGAFAASRAGARIRSWNGAFFRFPALDVVFLCNWRHSGNRHQEFPHVNHIAIPALAQQVPACREFLAFQDMPSDWRFRVAYFNDPLYLNPRPGQINRLEVADSPVPYSQVEGFGYYGRPASIEMYDFPGGHNVTYEASDKNGFGGQEFGALVAPSGTYFANTLGIILYSEPLWSYARGNIESDLGFEDVRWYQFQTSRGFGDRPDWLYWLTWFTLPGVFPNLIYQTGSEPRLFVWDPLTYPYGRSLLIPHLAVPVAHYSEVEAIQDPEFEGVPWGFGVVLTADQTFTTIKSPGLDELPGTAGLFTDDTGEIRAQLLELLSGVPSYVTWPLVMTEEDPGLGHVATILGLALAFLNPYDSPDQANDGLGAVQFVSALEWRSQGAVRRVVVVITHEPYKSQENGLSVYPKSNDDPLDVPTEAAAHDILDATGLRLVVPVLPDAPPDWNHDLPREDQDEWLRLGLAENPNARPNQASRHGKLILDAVAGHTRARRVRNALVYTDTPYDDRGI